jgi:hypothetical protein
MCSPLSLSRCLSPKLPRRFALRYYCNLTRPGQLQPGDNYHLFRGALQPAQETLPGGGCWLYRMKRNRNGDNLTPSASSPAAATALEVELNRLWEKLLLSLVGESIGEPCVVGAGVSVREHERVISVWCRGDVGDDPQIFTRVGRQLDTHVFGSAGRAPTAPGQSGAIGGGWSCQPLQWRAVPTRQPSAAASACTSHSPACAAATVAMANATLVSVSASASAASEASASSFVVS